jgi:hypothetical protein
MPLDEARGAGIFQNLTDAGVWEKGHPPPLAIFNGGDMHTKAF